LKSLFVLFLLPFPLFGSFLILKILNYNLSVAVWVGIIALLGISVGKFNDKYNAIHWAVVRRIRPITITTLIAFFSLIPIMFEFSIGADIIQK